MTLWLKRKFLTGILNLAVFDIPDAVARETGLQRYARIDAADVPETTEQ